MLTPSLPSSLAELNSYYHKFVILMRQSNLYNILSSKPDCLQKVNQQSLKGGEGETVEIGTLTGLNDGFSGQKYCK